MSRPCHDRPRSGVSSLFILLPLGLQLASCGAGKDDAAGAGYGDTGLTGFAARVDVHPAGESALQPQSFTVPDISVGSMIIDVAPTIRLSGRVTGYEIAPTSDVVIPGNEGVPVQASVRAHLPGTIVDLTTRTDADGDWSLELPTGQGYVVSVLPESPAPLPLFVETNVTLSGNQQRDLELALGVPVFGQIAQTDSSPLPSGAQARLRHLDSGIEGTPIPLSEDGRYLLRALPGEYELVIEGESTSAMPTISLPVSVSSESTGVEQNLSVGTLDVAFVEGRVFDADGDDVGQAIVRFTAQELEGGLTVEAAAVHETTTNNDGEFRRGVLPGDWTVEVIPAYEDDGTASPLRLEIEVGANDQLNLGRIELPRRTQASGQVVDGSGNPVSGAIVSFTERGFDRHTFSETTRGDGQFSRRLPNVPMALTLVPPTPNTAVTRMLVSDPAELPRLELKEGVPFSGTVTGAGDPLEFALIEVYDESGAFLGSTVTNADGDFRLQVLDAPAGLNDTGR